MAKRFLILILMVSTIFCVMSYSLPHHPDVDLTNCEDLHVPHIVIVNSTDGTILNCKQCSYKCPPGSGFGIPCNGQNVSKEEMDLGCVGCVAGVNFSTGDTFQCQPCQKKVCKDGMKIVDKCEPKGDKRTCKKCEQKNWYYNNSQKICQPCFCQNMTSEIKQICSQLFGFSYDVKCNPKVVPTTVISSISTVANRKNSGGRKYIVIISVVVVCLVVLPLSIYLCCVTKRIKKFRLNHQSFSVCSKDWFCRIFCFKDETRSRPPSYTVEDRNAPPGCASRAVHYFRQNSCPVTQQEKYNVKQSPEVVQLLPQLTECKLKNLKFFEMNAEVCRKICQALKQNIDTGMGYPTLAGYMDFTANDVKHFEEKGDPCFKMFECWSSLNEKENTVFKLKLLVVKLKRDDILELIKHECGCNECGATLC